MKTSIIVEDKTRNLLKKIGKKGDTYDIIIWNLINSRTRDAEQTLNKEE